MDYHENIFGEKKNQPRKQQNPSLIYKAIPEAMIWLFHYLCVKFQAQFEQVSFCLWRGK